jgi:BirA family biotin operon repressor/biotin-[acetyl-CoA-carboxylase] ligase
LISRPDILIAEEVTQGLNTKVIGRELYYFKTIDSTNIFAKKLVKGGIEEGVVVVADVQLGGRGRKNRTWSSQKGGLWFSIILFPNIPPQRGMLVTMVSSVAVVHGIEETTGLTPEIKWPNDLLLNGRKVCGILTELEAEMDKINYTVVGIGINVNNQLEKELQKTATTLKQEVGARVPRVELLRSILKSFDKNYNKLILDDYSFIRDSWLSHANIVGKKIQVEDEKTVITGVVFDIDDSGCLILDTKDGRVRIISGDVNYL